jgi:hypothetical protein
MVRPCSGARPRSSATLLVLRLALQVLVSRSKRAPSSARAAARTSFSGGKVRRKRRLANVISPPTAPGAGRKYTVCGTLGLDVAGYAIPYLASWSQDAQLDTIVFHAALIDRLARRIEDAALADTEAASATEAGMVT